jgi:hypothetical protein
MRARTIVAGAAVLASLTLPPAAGARRLTYTDTFQIERCTFASRGRNPYFPLIAGHKLELEAGTTAR